ncbi:metallophosphoesterase, partial [Methanocalculus natronophilus]|uniref:metallophosphoesterase n=1 Tax=Methanocalculus natronophilus TaxID=1262400 RepID=UPI0031B644F9
MKLFIISDLHGHFTVTKKALVEKGFEEGNKDHHLLCLGDYFDRGSENKAVYEYLTSLKDQASFILGNHDLFLLEFLEGDFSKADFNALHNG